MTQGITQQEPDPRVKYADIIDLPHWQSPKHPHMSLYDRAAQFSSYKALSGYEDMIAEEARITDREIGLEEHGLEVLNRKLARITELLVDGLDKQICFLGGDLVSRMVDHCFVFVTFFIAEGNDVGAESRLIGFHIDSHTDGFKGRTSLGIDLGIVGKYGDICGIAFGNHSFGNVGYKSHGRFGTKYVGHGFICNSKRSLIAELRTRIIGSAVHNKYEIFHNISFTG